MEGLPCYDITVYRKDAHSQNEMKSLVVVTSVALIITIMASILSVIPMRRDGHLFNLRILNLHNYREMFALRTIHIVTHNTYRKY